MTSPKKKINVVMIMILILTLVIISGFFIADTFFSKPIEITDVKIDNKAILKLDVLKQISKKNGITEWELEAASATLLKDKNKAILIDVSIFFFTKDNQKVHLTSHKGVLNTKTHDMIFSDTVVVRYDTSELRTEKLHYNKKNHIITSDTHVALKNGNSAAIEADSMITRLNDYRIILNGNIRGHISETFNIK